MKLKRAKAYKKAMSHLQLNFGFREPYQVVVDEEIILEAVKTKFDLMAGFERTLHGEVKPMITQCTMEHLYRTKNDQAIALGKQFERRRCGHIPKDDQTLSAFECIESVVNIGGKNKHRYTVATQKPKLRAAFRKIPAIPLIYINRSVMILEPLSPSTMDARKKIESAKLHQGLNSVSGSSGAQDEPGAKRTPKVRGPNPLSVKKRKTTDTGADAETEGPRTRRKRKRTTTEDAKSDAGAELTQTGSIENDADGSI